MKILRIFFCSAFGLHYLCARIALVAKLVDAPDLGSGGSGRVGSSPIRRTKGNRNCLIFKRFRFPFLVLCSQNCSHSGFRRLLGHKKGGLSSITDYSWPPKVFKKRCKDTMRSTENQRCGLETDTPHPPLLDFATKTDYLRIFF